MNTLLCHHIYQCDFHKFTSLEGYRADAALTLVLRLKEMMVTAISNEIFCLKIQLNLP
ncbi:hypothetical protein BRE01_18880 [Brevibacillus reuszeri]|uniref:Uncharacterized protein n=1 Tax=Brevibacillus reuszeri TaxID=54915 RepID=A0ABQ0TJY9_9BACL|nr:hypothetical protein BRE01_18880 [Brevibacillus reuszeri]